MVCRFLTVLVVILATGCGSPPTSPESTPPTVTVSGAAATAPAPGTVIPYASQPVTLLATLPVATPALPLTPFVDVATDAAFLSIVQTQPLSGDPGASVQLALGALTPGTYYWRVRAIAASTVTLSTSSSFTVGANATLAAPELYTADDLTIYPTPRLTVSRLSGVSRPSGRIEYRFDVALSDSFLPVFQSTTVSETTGNATFSAAFDGWLPFDTTFYWRVLARDTVTGASAYSAVRHFSTTSAVVNGQAALFVIKYCNPSATPTVANSETHAFDGTATTSTTGIEFSTSDSLRLVLSRTTTGAEGTLRGRAFERLGFKQLRIGPSAVQVDQPVSTSASVSGTTIEGAFSGYLEYYYALNPSGGCTGTVNWRLFVK